MSTMLSENIEAEKINKINMKTEQTIEQKQKINMALNKANEISRDLYNFKIKSREIQLKIQRDLDIFKLYEVRSLEELNISKGESMEKFLNSLNDLKLELKEAAALIVNVRKLSNLDDSTQTSIELNKTCRKLEVVTNALFCKTVHVMWIYALLKTELSTERTNREIFARFLIRYLPKETLVQPASALIHEHGSLSKTALSDAISEMNKMIGKLSFPLADEVPVSKRQISNEKQQPITEPVSKNIHSEIKALDTGLTSNPNSSLCAANKTASNISSSYVPEPTKASEPLGSFKFEPAAAISRASELKTESILNETSKLQANGPQPNVSKETPTLRGTSCVKFFPIIEVIEADIGRGTELVAYFNRCITMMKVYENKSLEELRLEDYFIFGVFGHQQNNQPLFGSSYVNLLTKDFKILDAIHVKFHPTNDIETCEINRMEADRFQCITLMNEFKNQSFEELRLADYLIARVFPPETFWADGMGTACVRFIPRIDTEWNVKLGTAHFITVRHQYITSIKVFENKSLEELRLEDYIAGRRGPTPNVSTSQQHNSIFQNSEPESSTNKTQSPGNCRNTPSLSRESPTQPRYFEAPTQKKETAKQDGRNTSSQSRESPTQPRYFEAPTQKKETAKQNGRNTPSQSRESPTQPRYFEAPTQKKETVKQDGRNTPSQSRESSLQPRYFEAPTQKKETAKQDGRNTPSQSRKSPTQPHDFEAPTQKKETAKQDPETSRQYWETSTPKRRVSDENAAAAERLLKDGKTEEALKMASDALKQDPENVFFLVYRARAYYELKQYQEALEDSQKAESLSPNLPAIGYLSMAKCYLALGQIAAGEQAVRRAMEKDPSVKVRELREAFTSLRSKQERVALYISLQNYYDAVRVIDHCLKCICPASSMMKLMKAECLAHMKKYDEARSIVIDLSLSSANARSRDAVYADAMYVTGLCSYYQENDELATKHFRKVLENDPDHEKAIKMFKLSKTRMNTKLIKQKKELGNKAFNAGDWKKAMDFYDEALSIDKNNKEENAKLHYNKATVFAKLDQPKNAIKACTAALEIDGNYIKALLKRAQCYKEIEMYEESLDDYEKIYYIDSTKENELLMEAANSALKANRGANYYYKVLGISMYATQDVIKKAYRKCALLYHPDKHASASLPEMRKNERKFKLLKEAYDLLSDPVSRANYDLNQNQWSKKY